MSEGEKRVDANSAEFKQGVEARLNSKEDTQNWKAGINRLLRLFAHRKTKI